MEDEAVIVAFQQHTLLPLDDCHYALQATIPRLTRSSLHRFLQRHGIGRLPEVQGNKPIRKAFKAYPIGFFHIDIAEVQTAEGKLYLFVAIDRTSKFAFTALHVKATTRTAADFLRTLVKAVPYKIHTVLTDNGIHFTDPKGETWTPAEIRQMITRKEPFRAHAFEYACALADIDHRLTKPKHPWTTDEVEQSLLRDLMLFSGCPWVTAPRRAGHEVRARPRSVSVAPPLRRLWAPSVRAVPIPRLAGDTRSRPVRLSCAPQGAFASDCRRMLPRAGRGGLVGLTAAPGRVASWHAVPGAPRHSLRRAGAGAKR